jgi:hypothetical protein
MDAQERKLGAQRRTRPLIVRLVAACLAVLLAAGLWQGYGAWLLDGPDVG